MRKVIALIIGVIGAVAIHSYLTTPIISHYGPYTQQSIPPVDGNTIVVCVAAGLVGLAFVFYSSVSVVNLAGLALVIAAFGALGLTYTDLCKVINVCPPTQSTTQNPAPVPIPMPPAASSIPGVARPMGTPPPIVVVPQPLPLPRVPDPPRPLPLPPAPRY